MGSACSKSNEPDEIPRHLASECVPVVNFCGVHISSFYDRRTRSWDLLRNIGLRNKFVLFVDNDPVFPLEMLRFDEMLIGGNAALQKLRPMNEYTFATDNWANEPMNSSMSTLVLIPFGKHLVIAFNTRSFSALIHFITNIAEKLLTVNKTLTIKHQESIDHLQLLEEWIADGFDKEEEI